MRAQVRRSFIPPLRDLASCIFALLATAGTSTLGAQSLTIVNAGFEDPPIPAGTFETTFAPAGWTEFGNINFSLRTIGVLDPQTTLLFPAGAPEGDNVGVIFLLDDFANQTVFADQEAGMFQVLGDVLQTSTTYNLTLDIGNIANAAPPNNFAFGGFPGYRVELRAGGQVLGFDENGVLPAEGEFVATSVEVEIGANHVQAGQPLEIRLINLNSDVGIEVNFDDLQLTATALPTCQYDLGFGGPGDLQLSVCGETLDDPSNSAELLLTGVEPFGQIGLILGLAANPVPFVGGTLAPFPVLRVKVLSADATGVLSVPVSGLATPFATLIIQALAVDGGGAYELSNALQLAFGL